MNIKNYLDKDLIKIGTLARNRADILYEIATMAKGSPLLENYSTDDIFNALLQRENQGSTAFGNGIAIPHCSLDSLDDFVFGLITAPQGIEFNSSDDSPSFIFFFIIGPTKKRSQHIFLLSAISKLIKRADAASDLAEAESADEVISLFLSTVQPEEEIISQKEKCIFHVLVQNEEYFQDILQIFAASVPGSVTVLETNNAGTYLHTMPLFSSFWHEDTRIFTRLIISVVDKAFCNDIIRRINMINDKITKESGVLVTVQDLLYTSGSIEF